MNDNGLSKVVETGKTIIFSNSKFEACFLSHECGGYRDGNAI